MQKCPFNSKTISRKSEASVPLGHKEIIELPSVPINIGSSIPFVPTGFSGVKYQMGGVNPPKDNYGQYINHKYQISPPHPQNSQTPCSVIGEKPLDFNEGPRKCFTTYSKGQNMVGKVCTTVGTEGPLFSREKYDGEGVNGNADWVRGNQFSVHYNQQKIEDRMKYNFKTPALLDERKTYIGNDPFYPVPDRCRWNNSWYKTFPRTDLQNYTSGGFPKWKYPYNTTQPNSRAPVSLISGSSNQKIIENFTDSDNTGDIIFYSGLLLLSLSFYYCICKK